MWVAIGLLALAVAVLLDGQPTTKRRRVGLKLDRTTQIG